MQEEQLTSLARIPQSEKLRLLGITPEIVLHEYLKVANQDKDNTNKLRALKPLLKEIGIDLDLTTQPGTTNLIQVNVSEKQSATTDIYDVVEPKNDLQ